MHAVIGKASFGAGKLGDNAEQLIGSVLKAKPSSAKGQYVKSVCLSSTMGPGISVDPADLIRK